MTKELHLQVITPERKLLDRHVTRVTVPELDGYVTLLPGHASIVGEVGFGDLQYEADGVTSHVAVTGGFLQVDGNIVRILANSALVPEEINAERARNAEKRAAERLNSGDPNLDYERAISALNRAQARLAVISTQHMEA
jgi:F-type H+-transporting ATPase subunit epsilon